MKPVLQVSREAIRVVGLETRTRNADEMVPATARIPAHYERFFGEDVAARITHKVDPGTMMSLYSDYDGDENDEYSITLGYEVGRHEEIAEGLSAKTLPASSYAVVTTDRGALPAVVIDAWQRIWRMSPAELGGKRTYSGDFELYDERAQNPADAEVDIYISIAPI